MHYTIVVPGRMVDFFAGGDAGQGKPDSVTGYVGGAELNTALTNGRHRRYGKRGYSITVDISADAMRVLADYAETLLAINTSEPDSGEVSAARTTLARIGDAR